MTIRVALHHRTTYQYDRLVTLSPQIIRLRPAPHNRTPIVSYSLKVQPENHFENWQQDPQGNFMLRCVFPEPVRRLQLDVDLVADMTVINPFDFFVESSAEEWPFTYEAWLDHELKPFLVVPEAPPRLSRWISEIPRVPKNTVNFLVDLNARLAAEIQYLVRMEPGVQSPEETLTKQSGSCRDSAWLLVHILRHLGIAARFTSGYLIQLTPDQKPLEGPEGPEEDFTDLHAWAEAYIPGAGWIGLDPTSGLLAGEGHIPLASTPEPATAAPISGGVEACETEFEFAMSITRIHEDARVTKPYTDDQWQRIADTGSQVDERLSSLDVRLTMGGEPTFVSIDDMDGREWTVDAVGVNKERKAAELLVRLANEFAPHGLLHFGQGKWYPGESLPRWAYSCYWRRDGEPIWKDRSLLAMDQNKLVRTADDAKQFTEHLASNLEVSSECVHEAYEDCWHYMMRERKLPTNVDLRDNKLEDPEERARLASVAERGITTPVGYLLPLQRQWWQAKPRWTSGRWPVRSEQILLLPGDSPMGLRLPLDSLPYSTQPVAFYPTDPSVRPVAPLPPHPGLRYQQEISVPVDSSDSAWQDQQKPESFSYSMHTETIRTALCVEPRNGRLHIFMPPTERLEDYLDLVHTIEQTAADLQMPVVLEGYVPPHDDRICHLKVTPDPGVLEVNTHPVHSWDELVESTTALYEQARQTRLGTEKFDLDGRHTGTGGGNHVVMGGATVQDSPFLRRPDLLKSLLGFWNNHPSLSYLFSSTFIGPTSQAPRVDEGRRDALYELQIAFDQLERDTTSGSYVPPWLVDRLFRNLLVDLTGNTHRAEFCIDKLYSPDSSTGRLGLLEFRGFEMPPHARMSLTQQLLLRALVALFWDHPYRQPLIHWEESLHDRFLLPHFVRRDFQDVLRQLKDYGFQFDNAWYEPHFEFRFPTIGELQIDDIHLQLRQGIEPWYVLGEEPGAGGTTRYVDSSVERLQIDITGLTGNRYRVACNGFSIPMHPTGTQGHQIAGIRYRAWQPPSCLHPTIGVHTPLVFDIVDTYSRRSIGGCTYYVAHPAGRNYEHFPVNASEAEARRAARFMQRGHTPGEINLQRIEPDPHSPVTLDLRKTDSRP